MVFYWTVTSETQYSNKLPSKYHLGLLNDWYTNDIPNTICPLYKLPSILILFQHCIVYFRCFPIIIHVGISQFFPVNSVYKNNKSHKQTLKCLRKIRLDSKYGERTAFQRTEWRKKIETSQRIPKSWWQWQSPFSTRRPRVDCKLAWISAFS